MTVASVTAHASFAADTVELTTDYVRSIFIDAC
jgi:hypothetical protein